MNPVYLSTIHSILHGHKGQKYNQVRYHTLISMHYILLKASVAPGALFLSG